MSVTPLPQQEPQQTSWEFRGIDIKEPPAFTISSSREWDGLTEDFAALVKAEQAVAFHGTGNVKGFRHKRKSNGNWGLVVEIEAIDVVIEE